MKTFELVRQKQRLDSLFEKVRSLDSDQEMQSHWAKYLCVLVSGYIEVAIQTIMSRYAESRADIRVANFVERELRELQNAKIPRLLEWVEKFDREWKDNLDQRIDDRQKEAVNAVVGNRHQIAHGRTVGLGFVQMTEYYKDVVKAIESIEELFQ